MPANKIIQLAIAPDTYAKVALAAKDKMLSVPAFIRLAIAEALPKPITAKLSAAELKELAKADAKAKRNAEINERIEAGFNAGKTYGEATIGIGAIPTPIGQAWQERFETRDNEGE